MRSYKLNKTTTPPSGIDYAAELNEEQLAVVDSPSGISLVIAGAGSGKTRTLTYRVARLIEDGLRPWEILLLTFTNKASKEMLERVQELLPERSRGVWGGTFHSFANRILRQHAEAIGYTRSFSILDADDQKSLMGKVLKDFHKEHPGKEKKFPKADVLMSLLSLSVNTGEALDHLILRKYPQWKSDHEQIIEVIQMYKKRKKETNSLDFDDLLYCTLRLFKEKDDIRRQYANQFKAILVDEYQDTNNLQDELIHALIETHGHLMVVGDDAQSIYSWRGANVDHILDFQKKYPTATIYKIEKNYRSVPGILELSNAAIQGNNQIEKTLISMRDPSAQLPVLVPTSTPSQQAMFIAQRILELREEGRPLDEIAILYRSHYQSLELQLEFQKEDIPFQLTSGLRFFEQAHTKDVLAFLRLMMNPADAVAFERLMNLLSGVGPATVTKLWNQWRTLGFQDLKLLTPGEFTRKIKTMSMPKKAIEEWVQLVFCFEEMIEHPSPNEMIHAILKGPYEEHLLKTYENCEQRTQDIEYMMAFSESFETLEDFLSQCSLLTNTDNSQAQNEAKVTLSTIHQAKGLEWHTVFVIGLAEGLFPLQRTVLNGSPKEMEEERRLFYVAVTRARDELYLTYPRFNPRSYSGDLYLAPSQFLDSFSESMIERWKLE